MKQKTANVILLHGRFPEKIEGQLVEDIPLCNPNNEGNWMGWTKKQLENKGYSATCPYITTVWKAPYEQWKVELDNLRIEKDTTLVGWSAGGYAILRYLGESGKQVKKVILIAPGSQYTATDVDPLPSKNEFYSFEITRQIKHQIRDGITIFVSNDSPEILQSVDMYQKILNAKVITLKNLGHFSFLTSPLPELVQEIIDESPI